MCVCVCVRPWTRASKILFNISVGHCRRADIETEVVDCMYREEKGRTGVSLQ